MRLTQSVATANWQLSWFSWFPVKAASRSVHPQLWNSLCISDATQMWLLSPWCASRLDRPHCLSLRQNHPCIVPFIIMILRNPGSCPDLPTLKLVQILARGSLLLWSYKGYSLLMRQCSTLKARARNRVNIWDLLPQRHAANKLLVSESFLKGRMCTSILQHAVRGQRKHYMMETCLAYSSELVLLQEVSG